MNDKGISVTEAKSRCGPEAGGPKIQKAARGKPGYWRVTGVRWLPTVTGLGVLMIGGRKGYFWGEEDTESSSESMNDGS
jgi:hypothetical protein